jgi:nitrogen fixation protein FixH
VSNRALRWPIAIVAILAATVAANIAMVFVIADDPSESIEDHYYEKGVNFDAGLALAARGARLGWTLSLDASTVGPQGVTLTPRLTDKSGAPLSGATVRVVARHVAHSADAVRGRGTAGADGATPLLLPMHRAGLWDIEVEAWRAGEHVTETRRLDLAIAPNHGP